MTYRTMLGAVVLVSALGIAPALASSMTAAGMDRSERDSSVYTAALNGFMAHGWHAVQDMRDKNGLVVATGVNAQGQVHGITYDAGSDTVKVNG